MTDRETILCSAVDVVNDEWLHQKCAGLKKIQFNEL